MTRKKLAGFYVVGSGKDSGADEFWDIGEDIGETINVPMYYAGGMTEKKFIEHLQELYETSAVPKSIIKAWEDAQINEVHGQEKINILKKLDEYVFGYFSEDSNYAGNYKNLIVYRLLIK